MKKLHVVGFVFLSMLWSTIAFSSASEFLNGTSKIAGVVTSVNVSERTIVIDSTPYVLSEELLLANKNDRSVALFSLQNGQNVECWITYASGGELPMVKKVKILSTLPEY